MFSSLMWLVPFFGIILSMSFLPILVPIFWSKYSAYVPAFWTLVYLSFVFVSFDVNFLMHSVFESIAAEYLPFIILIASLYITSGGIYVEFKTKNIIIFNSIFLFLGSIIAGWIGTTGAAMLLIRPFLRINKARKYKTHLVIFFIFLISNIGGAASPLGDPPLFIGYINGIDFFWFIKNLFPYWIGSICALCIVFFIVDSVIYNKHDKCNEKIKANDSQAFSMSMKGQRNVFLIFMILSIIIFVDSDMKFSIFGVVCKEASLYRNLALTIVSCLSLVITPKAIREKNEFSFTPIREVSELFAGIFITVTPIIQMLHQGASGSLKFIFDIVAPNGEILPQKCFWISGVLSSVLDNAPTFLIFFHMASGDAQALMTSQSHLLIAISLATVFMGAMTYIGNAPNLMVKSISEKHKVEMPSFLGYIGWSILFLVPIFIIISAFL